MYWAYIVALFIIILMIIYALVIRIFPKFDFRKEYIIPVIFSEQIEIPQLKEYGCFWIDEASNHISKGVILNRYNSFMDVDKDKDYEISFLSDDKKVNEQQLRSFHKVLSFDIQFYNYLINSICDYYNEYYFSEDDEDWNVEMNPVQLKNEIELVSVIINREGTIGLSFGAAWDSEHSLGVLIKNNKIIDVGGADVAIL